ncbi:MAG: caspase family protein [Woeseiaceae bacterium]|nr:caspase family protein [Woeseiaceae bacterium]
MKPRSLVFIAALIIAVSDANAQCADTLPTFLMDTDRFQSGAVDVENPGGDRQKPIRGTVELAANVISASSPVESVQVVYAGETQQIFNAGDESLVSQGPGAWKLKTTIGPVGSEADIVIDFGTALISFVTKLENGCELVSRYSLVGGDSRVRAVIVGVSDYQNVQPLDYAAEDAREFKAFLESYFEEDSEELYVDLFVEDDAKQVPIMKKIKDISRNISEHGTFIFYFSGHGTIAENEDEELSAYLVLQDSERDSEEWSMLDKQSIVTRYMANSKARKKIYVIDSCLSGVPMPPSQNLTQAGKQKRLDLAPDIVRAISDPQVANEIFDPPAGVIGLVSSGGEELSYEVDPHGGVFTHFLKASADEMDPEKTGEFNYAQLVETTKQKIISEIAQLGQNPQVLADPGSLERNRWLDDQPIR